MATARHQLLGLDEELDFADAATTELDVVSLDRVLVVAAVGMDLPFHGVDVSDRSKIEILAPDERRQAAEQRFARRDVAGTRPRLDHGGALPVLPGALVVVERGSGRNRDLGRSRSRAQKQTGAEHTA